VSVIPASTRFSWLKIALVVGAVVVGAGVGIGIGIAEGGSGGSSDKLTAEPDNGVTFSPGTRRAPAFSLRDESGRPISLASLRGRTVLLAFIDPVCRNLCPLEAKVLNDTVSSVAASSRPVVVAVSVNPWNQTKADLRLDRQKWHLVSGWRWALGSYAELARVWKKYSIGVQVRTKTLGGVTVREVDHTEAAYVIDPNGYERSLFLYPYRSEDVVSAVRLAGAGRSSSSQR
jgi:cytochrome oxidase Cu insertion factor (SCO1/SenC/PrrC family)